MKINFVCLITIFALFLFLAQESFSQIVYTRPTNSQSTKKESCVYSEKQIDLNIKNLPANYHGNNLKSLANEIVSRMNLKKDEFETTPQFQERIKNEKKKPLLGELNFNSTFAFESSDTEFQYDADRQKMYADLTITPSLIWSSPCQNSRNTLDKQKLSVTLLNQKSASLNLNFNLEIEKAKKTKPNLRTLIIASLFEKNGKYYDSDDLNVTFKEILLYDIQTGEIFLKQNISDYEKLKENEAKQEKEKRIKQMQTAKTFYENGKDDEAAAELRRFLMSDPTSAEAYFLLGKIHLRRGDIEQAVSSLKTALFWDNQLIDAHIALGKIYLERGDCLQAKKYLASALAIDSENQDAKDLQKQVEKCSR